MIVHLRQGIDQLKFGMKSSEVEALMGPADRVIIDADDEDEIIWEYTEQKLRLTFYQNEDDRLGYIRSSNPELSIREQKLIDRKYSDVSRMIHLNDQAWEKEDFDLFASYFLEAEWITLNVEYACVTDIEFGVPFKLDGEYDWPE